MSSGPPYPELKMMNTWDPNFVRVIEVYDINWDIIIRHFSYLGPDGLIHHVKQPANTTLEKLIDSCKPFGKQKVRIAFKPSTLDREEMIDKLHEHCIKTYA